MSARSSIGTLGVLLGCLYLIGAPVAASDEPSPSPSDVPTTSVAPADTAAVPTPVASMAPGSPAPSPTSAIPPGTDHLPLPVDVTAIPPDVPTVSISPASEPGLVVGTPIQMSLGHCGLWSPVDLDGSLWQAVGGSDAAGGPIDGDDEIGELINATPGSFVLLTTATAELHTTGGLVLAFVRAPGALDFPLCM
jgi:hypothetical protein